MTLKPGVEGSALTWSQPNDVWTKETAMTTPQERLDPQLPLPRLRALVPESLKPPLRRLRKHVLILRYQWLVRLVDPRRDAQGIGRRLRQLSDAADKGIKWALRELQSDAITDPGDVLSACYKGVWALSLAGRETQAKALLERLTREMSSDGGLPAMPASPRHYIYRESFIAIGAHALGEREVFESMAGFVAAAQDPRTGGFWSLPPGSSERWIDSASTAIGGLVLLRRGDLESATGAAEALAKILGSQPTPREVFYTTMGGDGNLVTDPSLPRHRAIHVTLPDQPWFFLSLASLFLVELYKQTGDKKHLDLAIAHIEYLRSRKPWDRFFVPDSGKTAVATAELYRLTGDKSYAHISLSTSAFIAGKQFPNGRWSYYLPGFGKIVIDTDLTFEYILWLTSVTGSFGMGEK
jgi:hypothetical protein